jgi:hypothetical protein
MVRLRANARFGSGGFSHNSMNDWLTIEQGESGLVWKPSGMGFGRHSQQALASKEEAAEYFWRRFTEDLA